GSEPSGSRRAARWPCVRCALTSAIAAATPPSSCSSAATAGGVAAGGGAASRPFVSTGSVSSRRTRPGWVATSAESPLSKSGRDSIAPCLLGPRGVARAVRAAATRTRPRRPTPRTPDRRILLLGPVGLRLRLDRVPDHRAEVDDRDLQREHHEEELPRFGRHYGIVRDDFPRR